MIETTIPEINVTELMERVRREAARIEFNREHSAVAPAAGATLPLPKIAVPPPVRRVRLSQRKNLRSNHQNSRLSCSAGATKMIDPEFQSYFVVCSGDKVATTESSWKRLKF